jgi:uncharacterized protein (TIGR02270 family)
MRPPPVLWDVIAEHLDEAGWLWEQRERVLGAVDRTLPSLEAGEEARLLAHLDALVIGGSAVADRVLVPALGGDEPRAAGAAAWALLAAEEGAYAAAVLEAVARGRPENLPAIRAALELSPRPALDAEILRAIPAAPPPAQAALLEALAFREADAGPALDRIRTDGDPVLLAAAVRAARFAPAVTADAYLRVTLAHRSPAVREAALETGLALGRRSAWAAARQRVEAGEASRAAVFALALGGEPGDLDLLVARTADPALRDEALWALGFSGRPAAADAALAALAGGGARTAAEAFGLVTGSPRLADAVVESEEEASPAPLGGPDPSRLPGPAWPEAEVIGELLVRWWTEERKRFDPAGRYWRGSPLTPEVYLAALAGEPLRLRPALALDLAARSRGTLRLEPRALGGRQRAQLSSARAVSAGALARSWVATMSA